MNTDELKKLLKDSTTVLILENGEPSLVILSYDSYKKLLSDPEREVKINHENKGNNQPTPPLISRVETSFLDSDKIKPNLDWPESNSDRFQKRINEKESELLEKINKQILALKSEIDKEEKTAEIIESSGIDY